MEVCYIKAGVLTALGSSAQGENMSLSWERGLPATRNLLSVISLESSFTKAQALGRSSLQEGWDWGPEEGSLSQL